ncbi:hypothetical protein [Holospora undulata]|uniref:hypothetical protein n=1 Tax=Holospora undulata TaxID=1169117 RepID=UPI001269472A|nr:hypothetical protein [Holospora undulata]
MKIGIIHNNTLTRLLLLDQKFFSQAWNNTVSQDLLNPINTIGLLLTKPAMLFGRDEKSIIAHMFILRWVQVGGAIRGQIMHLNPPFFCCFLGIFACRGLDPRSGEC